MSTSTASTASMAPAQSPLLRLLPGVVVLLLLLALFRDTATAMVGIWARSETYTHAFLVPPIVLWLAWRRRAALAPLTPRAAPWVLLPMAAMCLMWLLAQVAGAHSVTQLALVAMIVLSVPAVFGLAVARELMFPLAFLFFGVPIGEFLIPPMIDYTADFTVAALKLSGIPVYREGTNFIIPTGAWSVVDACSGVRYLIASFMVGTLFAYLNYASLKRRLIFVAVSIVVPIVANWVRAYMIVMLGHLSGNKIAVGVDHLIYGWVFFGVVIMVMFWIGGYWAQPPAPVGVRSGSAAARAQPTPGRSWAVAVGVGALLAATQFVMHRMESQPLRGAPALALPSALEGGWVAVNQPVADWAPDYKNPSAIATRQYRLGDTVVGVWVGYYRDQGFDRKLISSVNQLVHESSPQWATVQRGGDTLVWAGGTLPVRTALLREPAHVSVSALTRLRVMQVNWVNGRFVAGDVEAKLRIALNRLIGRGDDAAALMFYVALTEDGQGAQALQGFVAQNLKAFTTALDAAARQDRLP